MLRLAAQDGGFPVAVSEAWKAEMLLVKILRYSSHLTFTRTFWFMGDGVHLFDIETIENKILCDRPNRLALRH